MKLLSVLLLSASILHAADGLGITPDKATQKYIEKIKAEAPAIPNTYSEFAKTRKDYTEYKLPENKAIKSLIYDKVYKHTGDDLVKLVFTYNDTIIAFYYEFAYNDVERKPENILHVINAYFPAARFSNFTEGSYGYKNLELLPKSDKMVGATSIYFVDKKANQKLLDQNIAPFLKSLQP